MENALSIARAIEASNRNAAQMETQAPVPVNSLRFRSDRPKNSKTPRKANNRSTNNALCRYSSTPICFCCVNEGHKAKHPSCPATGATCSHCGKKGHFQRVCNGKGSAQAGRERRGTVVTEDDSPDHSIEDEYLFVLGNSVSQRTVPVGIHGVYTPVIIDSGASVNVLDSQAFHRFRDISLLKTDLRVFPYGSPTPIPVKATFDTRVSSDSTGLSTVARFVVVENENAGSLFGKDTAIALGLLRVGPVEPVEVRSVAHGPPGTDVPARSPRVDQLVTQYASIFEGVGKLKNYQLKIHTDPTVTPVAQPLRRTLFHLRKDVEQKLQQLADLDIIEDAEGPTPWVSPLVAVPKSSEDIRVCVDMRRVNEAVVRERHPIPTLEETLQAMNGAKVFSKLDLRWRYHQIELHPDSRALTTFSTHTGLKRYKRLIFGLSSASEQYQYVIQETLQGIAGARNISDDIIIFGKDQEFHDRSLEETFKRLKECGLTLNKEKCLFSVSELVFFGFKVSAAGLSPDDKKVEAIQNARTPQNSGEVRSFLGLVNYCSRFIPDFSTLSDPLRQLTRKDVPRSWTEQHQEAFDKLKSALTSDCVMAHYDYTKPTQLRVDASPVGLGAILMQHDGTALRPVAFASRAQTDVERRYSQTEREALMVVWGCERFHIYLYGKEFTLYTDHKPLEVIYSPKSKPPPRIER